jgi:hypothetical protein
MTGDSHPVEYQEREMSGNEKKFGQRGYPPTRKSRRCESGYGKKANM